MSHRLLPMQRLLPRRLLPSRPRLQLDLLPAAFVDARCEQRRRHGGRAERHRRGSGGTGSQRMCPGVVLLRERTGGRVLSERLRMRNQLHRHGSRRAGRRDRDRQGRQGQRCGKSRWEELDGCWGRWCGSIDRVVRLERIRFRTAYVDFFSICIARKATSYALEAQNVEFYIS